MEKHLGLWLGMARIVWGATWLWQPVIRSTLQCQPVPKECTQKDMTIKRKRKVAINILCQEIIIEILNLVYLYILSWIKVY